MVMQMTKLFDRKIELIIDNKRYTNDTINIDFSVPFDSEPEPNICDVSIYNIDITSRNLINKNTNIILNAGYGQDFGGILIGKVADFSFSKFGIDTILKMMVAPGIDVWNTTTLSRAYKTNIKASAILKDVINSFGLEIAELRLQNDIIYTRGKVVSGMVKNIISNIAKETNSKLYIKNNVIFIRPQKKGTTTGFLLSGKTGLLGSPETTLIDDEKGYKVKMLLNHKINVDSLIQIQSSLVSGTFRVIKGKHSGDFITEVEVLAV